MIEEEKILKERNIELEKELAAKNQQLEIEAALEKVRAVAMGMKERADMIKICRTISNQLELLNVKEIRNVQTAIFYEGKGTYMNYEYYAKHDKTFITETTYTNNEIHHAFANQMQKGSGEFYSTHIKGDEVKDWIAYQKTTNVFIDEYLNTASSLNYYWYSLGAVALGISTYEPLKDEDINLFKRFLKVFELSYRRYLDIEQAEAQAREAQIEAALEKVRSRTMAMQKQNDLLSVIDLFAEQLIHLGFDLDIVNFSNGLSYGDWDLWATSPTSETERTTNCVYVPWIDHPYFQKVRVGLDNFKNGIDLNVAVFNKEEKDSFLDHLFSNTDFKYFTDESKAFLYSKPGFTFSAIFLKETWVSICKYDTKPFTDEQHSILRRFANAFGQAYTRFLDLQKAEAQAREAQIEAALEKVRSRSLAMHHSEELSEVVTVLFERMEQLGITFDAININTINFQTKSFNSWLAAPGQSHAICLHVPYFDNPVTTELFDAYERGDALFSRIYSKEEKDVYFKHLFELTDFKQLPHERKKMILDAKQWSISIAIARQTAISLHSYTGKVFSEDDHKILTRFSKVFDQAYTRFLDLEKAETQAREAKIEASLEKVRARAMAMQNSNELSDLVAILFEELTKLDLILARCIIWIFNPETYTARLWMANSEDKKTAQSYFVKRLHHPYYDAIIEGWKQRNSKWVYHLKGNEKKTIDELLLNETELSQLPGAVKTGIANSPHTIVSGSFNNFGLIEASGPIELNDEQLEILSRFTKVFDLTYTRFNDLKQTEASAKEAVKQAALDRIRADIASMRTVSDLDRIIPLIWNELTILHIPFIRCGVFIMDDKQQLIHTFLSTPDGKAIAAFHIPYNTQGNIKHVLSHWRNKKNYVDYWDASAFTEFAHILSTQGELTSPEQYLKTIPQDGFYLHFLPFLQGMLYVGNTTQLREEEIKLIQSVADAFSTAYARYEDFNKLEAAKQQVEKTLSELKQTQQQLIQSEKMASLGELTAGIAHEIQNPLNFVNNFSEVSNELIDEMKEELNKGDIDEAQLIAGDIKQNLEKINHHGKRADAIVKNMLQHSRTTKGVKEPTDINALCDEYLRLSYHGLRAKDKNFNAEFKTAFDESIDKINVVPQDIGRVLLNLFNNAFYAVNEKLAARSSPLTSDYKPTVSVQTKKLNDKVELKVTDNGKGIPQNIVDKIFQPFFTTKPTGQGTGLGLSLSYDIIKAHGGEIKVETKEGKGCEFIIQLPV